MGKCYTVKQAAKALGECVIERSDGVRLFDFGKAELWIAYGRDGYRVFLDIKEPGRNYLGGLALASTRDTQQSRLFKSFPAARAAVNGVCKAAGVRTPYGVQVVGGDDA